MPHIIPIPAQTPTQFNFKRFRGHCLDCIGIHPQQLRTDTDRHRPADIVHFLLAFSARGLSTVTDSAGQGIEKNFKKIQQGMKFQKKFLSSLLINVFLRLFPLIGSGKSAVRLLEESRSRHCLTLQNPHQLHLV